VLGEGSILTDDDRMHSSAQITKVQQALLRRRVVNWRQFSTRITHVSVEKVQFPHYRQLAKGVGR
jgi:hypothetical protein